MIGLIFLLLILSVLWAGVIFSPMPIPMAVAWIPTLVVALAFAAVFILRRIRARKAAQEIERTLQQQGDEHAKQVRPDLQPEIAAMKAEFQKAVSALKSSKLARGGADSLSVLPWYLIVGPPGVGKSTALINSGLQFPYLSAGGGVRGVGGTRNCQWWLTNQAVILDTAGRYTTEDDDHDEWFTFLDTLSKTRPRRPINGLLVAVNAAELVEMAPESAAELGQRIRERVDEVMSRLKMIVPVYVIFNKCDLLAGFVEMFGDLSKAERAQIWGFTEPLGATADAAELFRQRFDELAGVLEERSLQRITQIRRIEDREHVFQFPAQFEALRASLAEFIGTLFSSNVYQDAPLLRGAYFTSATQEGRPIDRVMQAMAAAFGVESALPTVEERPPQAKSYFLGEMFSKVIFPDQGLAVRSSKESKRQRNLLYAYAAAGFAVAALLMVLPTLAFRRNERLIDTTRAVIRTEKPDLAAGLAGLVPLQKQVSALLEDQAATKMSFGMDEGNALLASAGGLYAAYARAELVQPAFDFSNAQLRDFVRKQQGSNERLTREHLRYLEALKLHLILSRTEDEPKLDEALSSWAAKAIADAYIAKTGHGSDRERAQSQAALYLALLANNPKLALPRDAELVRASRDVLRHLDVPDLALYQLLEASEKECKGFSLTLADIVGGGVPQMKSARTIRGAFTKECFEGTIGKQLKSGVKVTDGWVLGPGVAASNPTIATEQVSSLYFEQYISEWRKFLESIDLEQAADLRQLLDLMESLTSSDPPPLTRLLGKVAYNTRIASLLSFDLGGGPNSEHKFSAKEVQTEFDGFARFGGFADKSLVPLPGSSAAPPAAIDKYQQLLHSILDAVRADVDNPQGTRALMTVLQGAITQVEGQAASLRLGWWQQPCMKKLLLTPIKVAEGAEVRQIVKDLNVKWCGSVYLEFSRTLAGRYPFDPKGADATLADVAAYFSPQGTLWAFYDKNLQADLQRMGGSFQPANPTAGLIFAPGFIEHLGRAQEITAALFPPNAKDMFVGLAVNVHPSTDFDLVRLNVNGQTLEYHNGPATWPQLKWPAEGNSSGSSLQVHSIKGETEEITEAGDWGLFRLLEHGKLKSRDISAFTVVWKFGKIAGAPEVSIDFRPARTQTPFLSPGHPGERTGVLLHPLRGSEVYPPAGVGTGGAVCQ